MNPTQLFKGNLRITLLLLLFIGAVRSVAQPLVANAGTPITICAGTNGNIGGAPTASYGSGPYTYSWSPATGLSSTTVSNPSASPTVTTTYTVTVTDAVASSSNSTVTVTVNPSPTVTANSPTICSGSSAAIISSPSGGTPSYSYYWSPSATLSSGFVASPTATPTSTTTYTLTVTDAQGCTGVTTSTVTVNPNPSAPTANNNGPVCVGTTLVLTASTVAGATYSWTGPSGYSASTQNPSIAGVSSANAGTYYVTATVAGCTSAASSTNVTINALPTVNAGTDQTHCLGSSTTFSASAPGAISYSWTFGDATTSTVLNPVHTYVAAGLYNATLSVTSSMGCVNSDIVQITVNGGPSLTTTGSNTSCNGMCDGSATVTAGGAFAPYTYLWNPGGITTPTAIGLCAGTYTVTVTNTIGCSATANYTVNQPTALTISSVTYTEPPCNGAAAGTATVIATGGVPSYSYLWTPSSQTTQTASGLPAGTYNVTVSDANGCNVSGPVTVTQPAVLFVNLSSPDTICIGSSSMISAAGGGGIPPYSYVWNDGSTNFSTNSVETVSPVVNTMYTMNVTDANGCTNNGSTTVTVSSNTNIYGHVTYSGGSLATGTNTVVLYNYLPMMTSFDTIMTTTVDAGGNYYFAAAPGDYLIKIFNDSTVHPLMIPTYYGDEYMWDSATVITHDCAANYVANIVMIEVPLLSGPGHVDGAITEGDGFGRAPGDPIPGVDIKLGRNPGGQLVSSTQTNSSGVYSFDNVPANIPGENYTIYVDIPGLDRISLYSFVVDGTVSQYFDMDYEADSSTIYTTQMSVGIKPFPEKENVFSVYPNPAKESITFNYTLSEGSDVSVSIYNVLGVKVAEMFNKDQAAGTYKRSFNIEAHNLKSGVYLISFVANGKSDTQRIVITE
jgi:hypothetical protein